MNSIVLKIEYDGTRYAGWQRQKNALSVQETIEQALKSLTGMTLSVIGAGRTDAGVHASGQVAHSRLPEKINIREEKLSKAINYYLPEDIRIIQSRIIDYPFHSTKDAIAREYNYFIHLVDRPLLRHFSTLIKTKIDVSLLIESAKIFLGKKDFTTFSKLNKETKDYVCDVQVCEWSEINEKQYKLTIRADRFVYGMVRGIVGAMIEIARGKIDFVGVRSALEKKDRNYTSPMAPANGLILTNVYYPKDTDPFQR
ncbi:MAG: tRNA pseudouridine(38-40) synthase TruA [Candidatus Kapabacteria bacterium]|nr:tRNA pseudouridine(38-40) synthase TruA [Candidatus Kapabacteria bacterium]